MKVLKSVAGLAALGVLAGCMEAPVTGSSGNRLDVEAYDAAVASIGCALVTDADYGAVEFQAGMTREEVLALTQRKLSRGQAVQLETGGIRLTTGACAVA